MLNKIGGLARALYILLAIVAGFVALSMMNVTLVLVVLGLVSLYGGEKWLVVLIPLAMLVWYGTVPTLKSGRN